MERAEQEALLDSYCSTREGRLERWRYRMRWRRLRPPTKNAMKWARRYLARPRTRQRTMPAPTSPRSAGVDEALLRRGPAAPTTRQRTPSAPPRPRPTNNEAEDIASSAEAPPCRQHGGGFPPLC